MVADVYVSLGTLAALHSSEMFLSLVKSTVSTVLTAVTEPKDFPVRDTESTLTM